MPGASSPWRANDVVAYDLMREAATRAFALLHTVARAGGAEADAARDELARLRRDVLAVDAYDRAAVGALAFSIHGRMRELEGRAA